jgi:hypothetical protein
MNAGPGHTRRHALQALAASLVLPGCVPRTPADATPPAQHRPELQQTLERYAAAWRANNMLALMQCYHADFTLHYGGNNPFSGEHRGRIAAIMTLAKVGRRTNRKLVDIVDVMAGSQRGAILARETFERGALKAQLDRLFVYTVKENQLHECWVYDADQPLVDQFLADA